MEEQREKHYQKKTQRDYSLAFKLEIVDAIEKGELTYKQAQLRYGIQGRSLTAESGGQHQRILHLQQRNGILKATYIYQL